MTGTALVSYEERFAKDAAEHAAREARSGASLSTKGGTFSLGGNNLGPRIAVVVIDSFFENNFYHPGFGFDSENPMSPICYAFNRNKKSMAPDPSMQSDLTWFQPQNSQCEGCPQNEWGSSDRGRGKACQNRERLVVIPAGFYTAPTRTKPSELQLFDDPAHYQTADAVALRVPVTSGESWAKYVTQLAASHRRPPYAVITDVSIVPDPKTQYKLNFELIELCPEGMFDPLIQRVEGQVALPYVGYQAPTAEQRQPQAPQQRSATGLRGGFGRR